MKVNNTLNTLNLGSNDIGDKGATQLAEVLKVALTEEDFDKDKSGNPDYSYYGAIKAKYLYSEQEELKSNAFWF